MDESDPLFIYPPEVPIWTLPEAARMIAGPALTEAAAYAQLQRYKAAGLIHGAGLRDGKGPLALPAAAILTGAVLSTLQSGLCVSSAELNAAAALALYTWDKHQLAALPPGEQRPGSPVVAAAVGAAKGEFWSFNLTVFRVSRSKRRVVRAWTYNPGTVAGWHPLATVGHPSEDLLPVTTATVCLPTVLLPIYDRMMETAAASRVH